MEHCDQRKQELFWKLYRDMKRIRMAEDTIADNYYNEVREMHTPLHLCCGQEAVAVGVCGQLEKEDVIFSNHRSHGHYLAKGGSLNQMIAELFSKETGCCRGKGGSMHLVDREAGVALCSSIVAGNVPIATGYAMGFRQRGEAHAAVSFFGDGASEEGAVYESVCFAKIHRLPIVYVCENNLYAVSTGYDVREPLRNVSEKFRTILPTRITDGNDVLAVRDTFRECLEAARNGQGPALMECLTYRTRDHSNVWTGVERGYQPQAEWDAWKEKDPILRLERELAKRGWMDAERKSGIDGEIAKELAEAFAFARQSALPDESSLYENLWG